MTRHPVKSGAIAAIGHDGDVLEVEFHSGKVYRHAQFSVEDLDALLGAESLGRHYNTMVRGKYEHTLVEPDEKGNE